MHHAEIRAELSRSLAEIIGGRIQLPVTLHPYQRESIQKFQRWLDDPQGSRRAHLVYATGLGKTIVFSAVMMACTRLRVLVVVPTKTLIEQTARVIHRFTGGMLGHLSSLPNVVDDEGRVIAVRNMADCDIVITTDESLSMYSARLAKDFQPHVIVYDECHCAYQHPALFTLQRFPEAVIIGFTATPDYLTNVRTAKSVPVTMPNGATMHGDPSRFAATHFGTLIDERSVSWGVDEGYLCPLTWGEVDFEAVSLDDVSLVNTNAGWDYRAGELAQAMQRQWPISCQAVMRLFDDPVLKLRERLTFAICTTVVDAEELANAIASIGVPSACVVGATSNKARREILTGFQKRKYQFVTSVAVLREGWDAPEADVCLMLRPTKSWVLYRQGVGRVLRVRPDGSFKVSMVIDPRYRDTPFTPLKAPDVFGHPDQVVRPGDFILGGIDRLCADEVSDADVLSIEERQEVVRHEGTDWWSDEAIRRTFGISKTAVQSLAAARRVRSKLGRTPRGEERTFYPLKDLELTLHIRLER